MKLTNSNELCYGRCMVKNSTTMKEGIVKAYYAYFKGEDTKGRRMGVNAFKRTVQHNSGRIPHLFEHNRSDVIGLPIEFGQDENGAWFKSRLSNSERGQEARTLYEEGIYREHSMGYYILNSHFEGDVEIVDEAMLDHVSTVLRGAHREKEKRELLLLRQ